MRIALLSAEYPPQPGGVGDYTRRLGEALLARGHAISVITIADSRLQIVELGHSATNRHSTIDNLRSDWGWRCWRDVIAALDGLRPDVLHIQYQTGAYGMRPAINLLPWWLRRLPARPLVAVTAHDLLLPYLFPKAGPLRRWVTRRLLADADAVVVTNAEDYAQVAEGWGIEHVALIPIGSNIPVAPPHYAREVWRGRLGVAAHETLIAYFGLISRSKGLDVLLGALERLPPLFRLLVVGGAATLPADRAYAEELRRRIDDGGLRERVIFTGHCAEAEVSAHLLAADLAALPFADGASFRRGSLLAALAHGVPVVTTYPPRDEPPFGAASPEESPRRGLAEGPRWRTALRPLALAQGRLNDERVELVAGLRSLVDGENVMLVPAGDALALAESIERLSGDRALCERLRAGGSALAAQFSWEAIAARHEALYGDLIGAAKPSTFARR